MQTQMRYTDSLAMEFKHELELTRKTLDRIPADKLGFKPHENSMTLGKLGSHIAESLGWVESMVSQDGFDIPADFKPFEASSKDEIMQTFDRLAPQAQAALDKGCPDEKLGETWTLSSQGQTMFEMPRGMCLRMWALNHMVHHRGQLSVYLRLAGAPVPAIYGPSADEQG